MAGKLVIGQAGGPTAVINGSVVGAVREAVTSGRFDAVWGMRRGIEGFLEDDIVDLTNVSSDEWSRIERTPGAALYSSRHKLKEGEEDRVLDLCRRHGISAFLYIGGNDSADTTHRLALAAADKKQEINLIAVPKTMDNDLPITDHCPGYGSSARYVAISAIETTKDTESMPTMYPIKLLEVMGRDAGWIVAATTLGKRSPEDGPHVIYPPEQRVSRERFIADTRRAYEQFGHAVVVVAETVRDENGEPYSDPSLSTDKDAFGHPLLRGTVEVMTRLAQQELGVRARFDKPATLQRMGMHCVSETDLQESVDVGRAAVRLALADETDRMVTLVRESDEPYHCVTESAPLEQIANQQRLLPPEFLKEDLSDTTEEFKRYVIPLLGPEPLPHYARLSAPRA